MRLAVNAALGLLSAFSLARAQTIDGMLLDERTRMPLKGVGIFLVADTSATAVLARTTSDGNGIFYLQAPALGTYRLLFSISATSLLSAPLVVNDSDVQREYVIDVDGERTYFEFQLDKQVGMLPNQPHPKYPQSMRDLGIEGEVLAQFVVDSTGRPEMWTFKILRSPHQDFSAAVRAAVALMRFTPAEIGGRKVMQMTQMPFVFGLNR